MAGRCLLFRVGFRTSCPSPVRTLRSSEIFGPPLVGCFRELAAQRRLPIALSSKQCGSGRCSLRELWFFDCSPSKKKQSPDGRGESPSQSFTGLTQCLVAPNFQIASWTLKYFQFLIALFLARLPSCAQFGTHGHWQEIC